jgi:hypothetical protein
MAKETPSGYILICPGCGHQFGSAFRANPCAAGCGRIAKAPPLTDGAFESAAEGDDVVVTKPENRPADEGGRAF